MPCLRKDCQLTYQPGQQIKMNNCYIKLLMDMSTKIVVVSLCGCVRLFTEFLLWNFLLLIKKVTLEVLCLEENKKHKKTS